ncbi:unnamed protein product [Camellia sinensis]
MMAPKIQRLVTPLTLQRKQARITDKKKRIAKAKEEAVEYHKLLATRTFDDGFPNLFISNAHGIRGQHVAFLASFSSSGLIFEQLLVIYALPNLFVSSLTLVLPFFPTDTSERMEEEGDVATTFTLARTLSNIPISRGGPTSWSDSTLATMFYHALRAGFPCSRIDNGAWKRFHKQLQHFPMTRNAKGLVAPAIVTSLGVLTHTLRTLVPVIEASGFATTAAITIIGTVVGSFR